MKYPGRISDLHCLGKTKRIPLHYYLCLASYVMRMRISPFVCSLAFIQTLCHSRAKREIIVVSAEAGVLAAVGDPWTSPFRR